jgi:hypothetical protein
MSTTAERRKFYVSGHAVELWEDADQPFGWGEQDLDEYARDGQWDLLFNALVLAASFESTTAS